MFFIFFKSRQLWSHLDHNSINENCRVATLIDSKIVLFHLCKFPQSGNRNGYNEIISIFFISTISGNECTPKAVIQYWKQDKWKTMFCRPSLV